MTSSLWLPAQVRSTINSQLCRTGFDRPSLHVRFQAKLFLDMVILRQVVEPFNRRAFVPYEAPVLERLHFLFVEGLQ